MGQRTKPSRDALVTRNLKWLVHTNLARSRPPWERSGDRELALFIAYLAGLRGQQGRTFWDQHLPAHATYVPFITPLVAADVTPDEVYGVTVRLVQSVAPTTTALSICEVVATILQSASPHADERSIHAHGQYTRPESV